MTAKNLHDHPFDEGTITKLEIFEAYTKEWLPVFVMSPYKHICIFDLFAGPGYDKNLTKRSLPCCKTFATILLTTTFNSNPLSKMKSSRSDLPIWILQNCFLRLSISLGNSHL